MLKIGDFSRLTQVTVKALRHYDRLGLLTPAHTDPVSGYRYYTSEQVARLNRLLALKDLGFSLEQVGRLLDADLSPAQLREMLLAKRGEVRGIIATEGARLERIEAHLRQIAPPLIPYAVTLARVPARRVASLRGVLPDHPGIGALFGDLNDYRRRHNLHATTMAAIWHDSEYRESNIDAEVTFATADPLPPHERIGERILPPVKTMACVRHHGPMATIGAARVALLDWIMAHEYHLAGPTRTLPLRLAGLESADNIIEIQYPVARAGGETGANGGQSLQVHEGG